MVSWAPSVVLCIASLLGLTIAFSHPLVAAKNHHQGLSSPVPVSMMLYSSSSSSSATIFLRGGRLDDTLQGTTVIKEQFEVDDAPPPRQHSECTVDARRSSVVLASAAVLPMALLQSLGKAYASSLQRHAILTKSATAGFIFAISDVLAQRLKENETDTGAKRNVQWSRTLTSAAVGFFYFGPAAHYWYDGIFRILPGTSLVSTLQKAALGQLLFGPTFTCIFFATSLMQSGTFSFNNWFRKIRTDLPGAWLAGAGFWPIVDLISYSLIDPQWIPLFVNLCSLFWTTYLVLKSYN